MGNLPFTLRQLEVFASLAAVRSFRGCAEQLGISQASVSNQIRTLEDQLGMVLFARHAGRRPALTAEGIAFLDDLRAFNAAAKVLARHRRITNDRPARLRLRIRVGQGLVDNFIRPRLDRFLADNPDIAMEFDAQPPSQKIGDDLIDRGYDFALLHLRADQPVPPPMRAVALLRGGIFGSRRFAEGRSLPLSRDEISALPFLMPNSGSLQEEMVLRSYRKEGISPRQVVASTQYFDVMATMLERGLGVASFSEVILPPSMRKEVIQLYPLEGWRLIWYRKDQDGDERLDRVQDFLLSALLRDANYPTVEVFDPAYA